MQSHNLFHSAYVKQEQMIGAKWSISSFFFFFHPVFVHRTQVMKQLVDTTQFTMVFIPPAFIPFQHYTGS